MTIYQHITTFAGRPVVAFDPQAPAPADPGAVAWRVDTDYDGGKDLFGQRFAKLLAADWADQIAALIIGEWGESYDTSAPIPEIVDAAGRLTALRALFLGEMTSEENEISWIQLGDVRPLLDAYPDLEVLRVRGGDGAELTSMSHRALRELAFESGGLPSDIAVSVGASDFPRLHHLELWLGTENYGGTVEINDLGPILTGVALPELSYLGLRDAEIADEVAAALAGAPVVARLRTLDLSLGALSDPGGAALLAGQPLTHLRRLDLHHHFLTDPMMARISGELGVAGVDVDLSDQQEADSDGDRYIAVSE